jgi:hypothetical protein
MKLLKQEQYEFWREHIIKADAYPEGQQAYRKINNLADSTYYKWRIRLFGKVKKTSPSKIKKTKPVNPFSPVVVSASQIQNQSYQQNSNLPDSKWVAEIITNVIRGLL